MASQKPKASTQEHLDLEDIIDNLVIFKSGWVGLVMTTTSVNFDLLSETEQDAAIYSYGAFLNSLTFPMETLIRSKKADITAYFTALSEAERTQPNPDLKRQIQKYRDFLQSIVQQKTVLDKSFYLIINFSPLELGFRGLTKKSASNTKSKMQLLVDAKASLFPRRDHAIKQMGRLGLTVRQLTTKELIELFYDIYNPAPTGTQRIILDTASYTVPIVQPAVETPTEPAVNIPPLGALAPQAANPTPAPATGLRSAPPSPTPPPAPIPISEKVNQNIVDPPVGQVTSDLNQIVQPAPQNPQIQAQPSAGLTQEKALENLKAATAKAAQILNQQSNTTLTQTPATPNQSANPITQQPDNLVT